MDPWFGRFLEEHLSFFDRKPSKSHPWVHFSFPGRRRAGFNQGVNLRPATARNRHSCPLSYHCQKPLHAAIKMQCTWTDSHATKLWLLILNLVVVLPGNRPPKSWWCATDVPMTRFTGLGVRESTGATLGTPYLQHWTSTVATIVCKPLLSSGD